MKMLPNTSLVRTILQLSVGVRGNLPPHNFIVMPNREVRLGCLFLAEIRQTKIINFVGESIEVIHDRASL